MSADRKPVVWLRGEIKTPPFSRQGTPCKVPRLTRLLPRNYSRSSVACARKGSNTSGFITPTLKARIFPRPQTLNVLSILMPLTSSSPRMPLYSAPSARFASGKGAPAKFCSNSPEVTLRPIANISPRQSRAFARSASSVHARLVLCQDNQAKRIAGKATVNPVTPGLLERAQNDTQRELGAPHVPTNTSARVRIPAAVGSAAKHFPSGFAEFHARCRRRSPG